MLPENFNNKSRLENVEHLFQDPFLFRFLMSFSGAKGTWFKYMTSGGYAVPLEHSKWASDLSAFMNGSSLVVTKIWPAMLFVMQLYDIGYFYAHPHERDGVTVGEILGGTAHSKHSYSSQWWNDFPSGAAYAAIPSALFFGMVLSGGFSMMLNHFKATSFLKTKQKILWEKREADSHYTELADIENGVVSEQPLITNRSAQVQNLDGWNRLSLSADIARSFRPAAIARFNSEFHVEENLISQAKQFLLDKAANGPFVQRSMARYLLWGLGAGMHGFKHKTAEVSTRILFWMASLYKIYAAARLLELWGFKLDGLFSDKIKRMTPIGIDARAYECKQEGKQGSYRTELGQFLCSPCAGWPIFLGNVFTAQGCLDSLMAEARTPADLVYYISQLKGNITSVDMSKQDWPGWVSNGLDAVLSVIEARNITTLDHVSFSRRLQKIFGITLSRAQRLAQFFERFRPSNVDISNLGLGLEDIRILAPVLSQARSLHIAGNDLGDDGLAYLLPFLSTQLQHLDISRNGIEFLPSFGNYTALKVLNADGNPLVAESFSNVGSSLSSAPIERLSLAQTDMSGEEFYAVTQQLSNSSLRELTVADNSMGSGLEEAIPHLCNSSVSEYNFRNVDLDDHALFVLKKACLPGKEAGFNIEENALLSDEGLTALRVLVKNKIITSLRLSGKVFSAQAWINFFQAISGSNLEVLSIANANIGDAEIAVFASIASNLTSLSELRLPNNQFSPSGIVELLEAIRSLSLRVLDLSMNLLNNASVSEAIGHLSGLQHLDVACTGVGDDFVANVNISRIGFFNVSGNKLSDVGAIQLAQKLLNLPFSADELTSASLKIKTAQRLWSANATSPIEILDMSNNLVGDRGLRAVYRVLPRTNIACSARFFQGNPVDNRSVDIHQCSVLPYNESGLSTPHSMFAKTEVLGSGLGSSMQWLLLVFVVGLILFPICKKAKKYFEDKPSEVNHRHLGNSR